MAVINGGLGKINVLRGTIQNWPLVLPDKLGLMQTCNYRTRSGATFLCRSKSTDINEVVVVMSGLEYPAQYLKAQDGQVIVDLGANIGSFVVYFDSLNHEVNYRGFAFEPFTDNVNLLKTNLAKNNVKNFEVVEAAVSDIDGTVTIDTAVSPDAISITEDKGVSVTSYKLSSFCRNHQIKRIDLLKMDVEGAEYTIFESDYEFIKKSVRRVILEYHILSEQMNDKWIASKTAADFTFTRVHTNPTNGIVVLENKRLKRKE